MNKEETRMRIGQRVKALRLQAGLSQEELAERAGLGRSHIGRIEDGRYGVQTETLQQIAEVFGMSIDIVDDRLVGLDKLKPLT